MIAVDSAGTRDGFDGGKGMYKTINFNIFEENLETLVYGEREAAKMREEYRNKAHDEKRGEATERMEKGSRPEYENRDR